MSDIYRGIIITDDNRYVKIMEITPIPFTLFSQKQQERTIDAFQLVLSQCPLNVQFSALTLPADLTEQKAVLEEKLSEETNQPLRKMAIEYKNVLETHERVSLRRRFFISFEYVRDYTTRTLPDIDVIVDNLNEHAAIIENALNKCGNKVVYPINGYTVNDQIAEILYSFFNRNSDEHFEDHRQTVLNRYREYEKENGLGQDSIYVNPVEYIAPSSLDFRNRQYIIADNKTYYTFAYIPSNGYNSYVEGGWMTMFINSLSGVDVTIKFQRNDSELIRHKIRQSIKMNKSDIYNSNEDSGMADDAEDALMGGRYLSEGLRYGADFYYANIIFTITGDSVNEVEDKYDKLRQMCRNQRIHLSRFTYQQETAFFSCLPLAIFDKSLLKKSERNMLTDGAASMYPFTTPEFIDPNGVFLGIDETSNTPVIPDIWNRSMGFVNMNIGIFGISGGGKTVTTLTLAARMRMLQIPVVIFACEKEHEYIRITNALGGKFISLATGSKDRINIMDIYPRDESADEEVYGTSGNRSYLEEKVETLIEWIEMKTGKLSPEDNTLLNIAIHETYARSPFNITSDNESLYDPTDPFHHRFKMMPIIEDLYNVLMEKRETRTIGTILSYYVKGSGKSFNGHTNVDLSNKFIVFGLEGMNEEDFPAGMHLALDYVWSKVKEDKTKRKAIFFDEFWKVCKSRSAVSLAAKMIRLVRAYSTSMVIATQELDDLLKYDGGTIGKTIMSNSRTRFLLQMDDKVSKEVGTLLNLTNEQIQRIQKEEPGHALLSVGSTYIKLNIINGQIERYLMYTDEKTLNEWKEHKEEIEELLFGDNDQNRSNAYSTLIEKLKGEDANRESTVRTSNEQVVDFHNLREQLSEDVIDLDSLFEDQSAPSVNSQEVEHSSNDSSEEKTFDDTLFVADEVMVQTDIKNSSDLSQLGSLSDLDNFENTIEDDTDQVDDEVIDMASDLLTGDVPDNDPGSDDGIMSMDDLISDVPSDESADDVIDMSDLML